MRPTIAPKCPMCGSECLPFDFLEDDTKMHRFHSAARLVGFSNPDGWRCTNSRVCTWSCGQNENGEVRFVLDSKVRHEERIDLKDGDIWEIVDEWFME